MKAHCEKETLNYFSLLSSSGFEYYIVCAAVTSDGDHAWNYQILRFMN